MRPPTLAQHRAMNITRPLTDGGIGAGSHAKRSADADHSRIISQALGHDDLMPGNNPPDSGTRRSVAECGTRSGYFAHRNRAETPCDPCREANREYERQRASDRRRRGAA